MELTETQMPQDNKDKKKPSLFIALIVLLSLAAFLYVSIIYKIINYGP